MRRFQPGERPRERWRWEERRQEPRVEPALPVQVCGDVTGVLHDISRTGICLLTDEPLEEGRSVVFDLVDDATGMRCQFQARVVWYRAGLPGRAGLEFVAMQPDQDGWLASRFVDWVSAAVGM
jgi:PilZ domain